MVDLDRIELKLKELRAFFRSVKENSSSLGDVEGASYGLSKIERIEQNLERHRKKPQNKLLKQIDAGFTSATRGVEGFGDYETNERFIKACEGIYQIKKDLEAHIKW